MDIAFLGKTAYVSDYVSGGMHVVDVSNVANPRIVGTIAGVKSAKGVAVQNPLLYVAASAEGLQAWDVSDPWVPIAITSYDTPGEAIRVAVMGDLIYLADDEGGLFTFRLRNRSETRYLPLILR